MDISFIIVNWNTKHLTYNAIVSIINTCPHNIEYEIIVVDNFSSDGSCEYLKNICLQFSNVIVLCMDKNIGYGPAHNEGLLIAKGEWVFFLNSDVIFLNNCIENLFVVASKDRMAGIYAPRILNKDLTDQDVYGYLVPYTYTLFLNMLSRKNFDYHSISTGVVIFEAIDGVAYFVHRTFLQKYGAWSTDFTMFCEDWDFCFRVNKNKKKCIMVADAELIHLCQTSSKNKWSNEERNRIIEISNRYFAKKHADPGMYELYWAYKMIKSFIMGYIIGINWEKDRVKAKLWFLKACICGSIEVEERRLLEMCNNDSLHTIQ